MQHAINYRLLCKTTWLIDTNATLHYAPQVEVTCNTARCVDYSSKVAVKANLH